MHRWILQRFGPCLWLGFWHGAWQSISCIDSFSICPSTRRPHVCIAFTCAHVTCYLPSSGVSLFSLHHTRLFSTWPTPQVPAGCGSVGVSGGPCSSVLCWLLLYLPRPLCLPYRQRYFKWFAQIIANLVFWVVNDVCAGTIVGYVCYDLMHYYLHHGGTPSLPLLRKFKASHAAHHYLSNASGVYTTMYLTGLIECMVCN